MLIKIYDMIGETLYIKRRQVKAGLLALLFLFMRIFPIKKNKVVFSFEGEGGYGCNPKYIAEELQRRGKAELFWITNDTKRDFPSYVKPVKNTFWNQAYHLSTARVWVDNYRKPMGTLKRAGQLYVQTWHASIGFKAVGLFRGKAFPEIARLVSEWDSSLADIVITNSDYCEKIYPKKLLYSGRMERTGSPRCDIIVSGSAERQEKVREKYGIKSDEKIMLYVPTFRSGNQGGKKRVEAETPTLDFERVLRALEKRSGTDWKILLRLHPQLSGVLRKMSVEKPISQKSKLQIVDASLADDVNEIVAISSLVVTDYSSLAFDSAYARIPVLLYADDMDDYRKSRGEFMWKRSKLPFLIAENNDEMEQNIKKFDYGIYIKKVDEFMGKNGVSEDGHASERVADIVEKWIFKGEL